MLGRGRGEGGQLQKYFKIETTDLLMDYIWGVEEEPRMTPRSEFAVATSVLLPGFPG